MLENKTTKKRAVKTAQIMVKKLIFLGIAIWHDIFLYTKTVDVILRIHLKQLIHSFLFGLCINSVVNDFTFIFAFLFYE